MPNILALSDLHGFLPDLSDFYGSVDLLVLAGDICDKRQCLEEQSDFIRHQFLPWIFDLEYNGIDVVGTWGNHDEYAYQQYWNGRMGTFLSDRMLINAERKVANLRTYGCPFSIHKDGGGVFRGRDNHESLGEIFKQIPSGLDILITHTPPFGILDYTEDRDQLGRHCGSRRLLYRLEDRSFRPPKLVVFGHIHNMGCCATRIAGVNFINGAIRTNGKASWRPQNSWLTTVI